MTITIVNILVRIDLDGSEIGRHANIIISDGITHYTLGVGDLPIKGDLQPILDAREVELWEVAQRIERIDDSLTTEEVIQVLFNSPLAGGWSDDEFQEAWFEERKGDSIKADALDVRRDAIKLDWPLP